MPSTSSCVSVMNCEVLGFSGSITCGCTPATPGTLRMASMAAAGSRPPAVNPAPMPIPRHRDLAEHEAIAALDEAYDALGHGAERDDARHSDRDAGDGEDVATESATQVRDHRLASDGRDWITGSPCLRRRLVLRPREIRVAARRGYIGSPRTAGPPPRDVLRLAHP